MLFGSTDIRPSSRRNDVGTSRVVVEAYFLGHRVCLAREDVPGGDLGVVKHVVLVHHSLAEKDLRATGSAGTAGTGVRRFEALLHCSVQDAVAGRSKDERRLDTVERDHHRALDVDPDLDLTRLRVEDLRENGALDRGA